MLPLQARPGVFGAVLLESEVYDIINMKKAEFYLCKFWQGDNFAVTNRERIPPICVAYMVDAKTGALYYVSPAQEEKDKARGAGGDSRPQAGIPTGLRNAVPVKHGKRPVQGSFSREADMGFQLGRWLWTN